MGLGRGAGEKNSGYGRQHTPRGKGIGRMLKEAQRGEITEYEVYSRLAKLTRNQENSRTLKLLAGEEREHAKFWKTHTNEELKPDRLKVFFHVLISKMFGLNFGLKLMESGEGRAQINYNEISKEIPAAAQIEKDESKHEHQLLNMIDDAKLNYVSSMVLGVSDALVELTGALAGLTFALQNTNLIALTGMITGIAASFSMSGSEYLSTKSEGGGKNPLKAAFYTGIMYLLTVILLILPYLLIEQVYLSLAITLATAILIIFCFTFYISVAQDIPFKKRFLEMTAISLGVSTLSFMIGMFVRKYFDIEI